MKNLVSPSIGKVLFSLEKTVLLYLVIIPCFFIDFNALEFSDFLLNALLMILTVGVGHSIGLHRGVIHKSYKTSKWFRNISLYLFVLTGLGSPLLWLKQHYFRDYWQNRTDCPRYFQYKHGLLTDYFWNLHLTFFTDDLERYQIPSEDLNDPWINFLHKYYKLHYLLVFVTIIGFTSLNTALFLMPFRTMLIVLGHWFIGYASHKFGYARNRIEGADESGYNDVVLGLVSFGEGFHNNHHSYPSSAKFSIVWYEIDFGWYLAWILKKLGIIWDVILPDSSYKKTARPLKQLTWTRPW